MTHLRLCLPCFSGYRVIACSLLPLSESSLKYGSDDGGRTIHTDEPALNEHMKTAAEHLNLKGHQVSGVTIHGPADLEVHHGTDDNHYVLDTARVWPAEAPSRYFEVSAEAA